MRSRRYVRATGAWSNHLEVQSSWSSALWWNLGETGAQLQESHVCDPWKSTSHVASVDDNNVFGWADTEC